MLLIIINYTVRGGIIVLGVLLIAGVIDFGDSDRTLMRAFGVICVLFGIYRISIYRMQQKKYSFLEEEEDE